MNISIDKVDEILDKEIKEYPYYPGSDYIRGLKRARFLIEVAAQIGEPKAVFRFMERDTDPPTVLDETPKPLYGESKNWLWLPGIRGFLSVKDIRSIVLLADESGCTVSWTSGGESRYYGEDFRSIWDFANQGRCN